MNEIPKKQERASLLSKRLIRTNKINSNEAVKLRERLDGFNAKHRQRKLLHEKQVMGVKANLNDVVSIKEKMEISPIRRKFLLDHGVTLQMRDVYMEDFITAVDNTLVRGESPKLIDTSSDSDSSSNAFSGRVKSARTASSVGTFPLHLPLNLLRRKSNARPTSGSTSSEALVEEEEEMRDKLRTQSARVRATSGPLGGKHQTILHRVITPPIKGRHIAEAYKEIEEDEKLVKKLLERKKFHERLKREDDTKKKNFREDNGMKLNSQRTQVGFSHQKEAAREKEDADVVANNRIESGECCMAPEEARITNNELKIYSSDEEFENLMQKYLTLEQERKTRTLVGDLETSATSQASSRSISDGGRAAQEDIDKLSPAVPHVSLLSDSFDDSEKVTFSDETPEDDSEMNENSIASPFVDSTKWNELVTKVRGELRERESAKHTAAKMARPTIKTRISRISHPTGIYGDDYTIYDARPDKSVAKGYAKMQMKVGQRTVSICMPRFKKEGVCKEQTAMRANVKSELKVEKFRKNKRLKKPIDSTIT